MDIIVLVRPRSGVALEEDSLKGTAQLLSESPLIESAPGTGTTRALWLLAIDASRADGIKNQLRVIWEGKARVIWRHTRPPEADEIITSY
jgi:hypothetical protein